VKAFEGKYRTSGSSAWARRNATRVGENTAMTPLLNPIPPHRD